MAAPAGKRVRAWVREDFGIDLTSIHGVGHGTDEAAQLWRAVAADGIPYAIKLSGGGTPAGLVVSAHLLAHGCPVSPGRCLPVAGGCGANAAVGSPSCRGCRTTGRSAAG